MSFESLKQRHMEPSAVSYREPDSGHAANMMPTASSPVDSYNHNEFLRASSSVSSLASASSLGRPSVLLTASPSASRTLPPSTITFLPVPPPQAPHCSANKMAISNLLTDDDEEGPPSRTRAAPRFPQYASAPFATNSDPLSPMTLPSYTRYKAAEEPVSQARFSPESNYQSFFHRSAPQGPLNRSVRSPLKRRSRPSKSRPPVRESKSKRPWTEFEDAQLRTLTQRLGVGLWAAIAEHIPLRTGKQVRERWLNHLSPEVHKRPWAPAEDRIIIEGHEKYGNSWSKICKLLEGRSENMCKNRFHCKLRKLYNVDGPSTAPQLEGGSSSSGHAFG